MGESVLIHTCSTECCSGPTRCGLSTWYNLEHVSSTVIVFRKDTRALTCSLALAGSSDAVADVSRCSRRQVLLPPIRYWLHWHQSAAATNQHLSLSPHSETRPNPQSCCSIDSIPVVSRRQGGSGVNTGAGHKVWGFKGIWIFSRRSSLPTICVYYS